VRSDLIDTDGNDGLGDTDLTGGPITDAELTALALACDPNQPLDPDATPLDLYRDQPFGLLPRWYMPPVTAIGSRPWRTPVVIAIIAAFLLVDAFGLCITYGQLIAA
jgi:hypothetical protein